jgi:hypothetical protein
MMNVTLPTARDPMLNTLLGSELRTLVPWRPGRSNSFTALASLSISDYTSVWIPMTSF